MKIPEAWLAYRSNLMGNPDMRFLMENSETITAAQLREKTKGLLDDYRQSLLANAALRMQKDGAQPTLAWLEEAPKDAAGKAQFLWCMAYAPHEFFGNKDNRPSSQDCRKYAAWHIREAMRDAWEDRVCAAGVDRVGGISWDGVAA